MCQDFSDNRDKRSITLPKKSSVTINVAKTPCIEDTENAGTIRMVGWVASPKHIHEESD